MQHSKFKLIIFLPIWTQNVQNVSHWKTVIRVHFVSISGICLKLFRLPTRCIISYFWIFSIVCLDLVCISLFRSSFFHYLQVSGIIFRLTGSTISRMSPVFRSLYSKKNEQKMNNQIWNISLHNLCTSISSIHNVIVVSASMCALCCAAPMPFSIHLIQSYFIIQQPTQKDEANLQNERKIYFSLFSALLSNHRCGNLKSYMNAFPVFRVRAKRIKSKINKMKSGSMKS